MLEGIEESKKLHNIHIKSDNVSKNILLFIERWSQNEVNYFHRGDGLSWWKLHGGAQGLEFSLREETVSWNNGFHLEQGFGVYDWSGTLAKEGMFGAAGEWREMLSFRSR